MMFYPRKCWCHGRRCRRAASVKWTEDRQQELFATTQERGQIHDAELAVTKDGKISV